MKFLLVNIRQIKMKKLQLFLYIGLLSFISIFANNDFPEPIPGRMVNDFSDILTSEEEYRLEEKLVKFNNETSTQIAIVTLDDIKGYDINEYAAMLGEKWGVGQKGKDNGIVILIAPKLRKVSIQVGYGLEGIIPDAIAKRIIQNEIIPEFKNGKYFTGLDKATNILISLAKKEYSAEEYSKKTAAKNELPIFLAFFILAVIIILVIVIPIIFSYKNINHISSHSVHSGLPWWLLLLMMSQGSSKSHRGKFNDFSTGRGSFGGYSGGSSFGGFGGGSFGGGGASGSW